MADVRCRSQREVLLCLFSLLELIVLLVRKRASEQKGEKMKCSEGRQAEEKRLFACTHHYEGNRPMRKLSARPTGNGKRIIILGATLLPL